jgi:hypothetical protein
MYLTKNGRESRFKDLAVTAILNAQPIPAFSVAGTIIPKTQKETDELKKKLDSACL